ncbi:MAG: MarR family transcriptional regulator [Dehalococcoidia bacterium]
MPNVDGRRQKLLGELMQAGREHSTATVLFHSAVSEKMGLGVTDMKTLDYLVRLGPLTAGEISEHVGLATASVTGLIDRLEQKGFVRRVRDTRDRRRVIVEPIGERENEFIHLFQSFGESLTELLVTYSDEQLETISGFLTRSAAIAREEAVKLRESG